MILDYVFQFLKAEGLTRTHATFSTDYLGHSPRYYDYLRCSGARPSLRALLKLATRLHYVAQTPSNGIEQGVALDFARKAMAQAMSR